MSDCFALAILDKEDRASAKRSLRQYPPKNQTLPDNYMEIRQEISSPRQYEEP